MILLVEDETLIRMVAAEGLEALGFAVEEAGTAAEALARLGLMADRIEAAVIDLGLPDRKGDALAVEIRAERERLPIVIASGYGEASVAGLVGDPLLRFLAKPYEAGQLAAVLNQLGVTPPPGQA